MVFFDTTDAVKVSPPIQKPTFCFLKGKTRVTFVLGNNHADAQAFGIIFEGSLEWFFSIYQRLLKCGVG